MEISAIELLAYLAGGVLAFYAVYSFFTNKPKGPAKTGRGGVGQGRQKEK